MISRVLRRRPQQVPPVGYFLCAPRSARGRPSSVRRRRRRSMATHSGPVRSQPLRRCASVSPAAHRVVAQKRGRRLQRAKTARPQKRPSGGTHCPPRKALGRGTFLAVDAPRDARRPRPKPGPLRATRSSHHVGARRGRPRHSHKTGGRRSQTTHVHEVASVHGAGNSCGSRTP